MRDDEPPKRLYSGIQRICKMYGRMKIQGQLWVWDYVADKPVKESEMPEGSERRRASEKKRWESVKAQLDRVRERNAQGF